MRRLVVGVSGASGAIYALRLLETLRRDPDVETHLVISPAAQLTIAAETPWSVPDVEVLANHVYDFHDVGAAIASGSFITAGMVVVPCSVKTLSAIANGYTGDLLSRSADVTLKEGRPLVLVFRETPLHRGHIRLMHLAAEAGAILFPPVPAFYTQPQTVDEIVNDTVGRILQRLGFDNELWASWDGLKGN